MRLSELLDRNDIKQTEDMLVTGLTADSREVKPGFVFAALKGSASDGRRFIDAAVKNGAIAILTDSEFDAAGCPVYCCQVANPRQKISKLAARFYGGAPAMIVAVTGTNGKTSVAHFVREIWKNMGVNGASVGTLGIVSGAQTEPLHYTSPEPVLLHRKLKELEGRGVTHVAIEASSHGLDQFRLDGASIKVAAFTNFTRDHLDYHKDYETYLQAKIGLVSRVVEESGSVVLNADSDAFPDFSRAAAKRELKIVTYGRGVADIRLKAMRSHAAGQTIDVDFFGDAFTVDLPLAGEFQAMNILCAAGMVICAGADVSDVIKALPQLKSVPGRLEQVATLPSGASVYVDFAHTPDALETVLKALRPHTNGNLQAVIGCGGDRDKGKRPQMGKIAQDLADRVYVTDDNPRTEDPADIRAEIMAACPAAQEIGDRKRAIETALTAASRGDIILIAGKGHESGQIIGDQIIPFNDKDTVQKLAQIMEDAQANLPLWTAKDVLSATKGRCSIIDWIANGVQIDSRAVSTGDLFIAILGPNNDGHDYVVKAFEQGATAAIVSRIPEGLSEKHAVILVDDTLAAMEDLGKAARARCSAKVIAVTGSVGKTGTKEALAHILSAQDKTHFSVGSFNNHWGVPLSLARMPADAYYAIFELGMNHAGELGPLSKMVQPHVAIITTVATAHLEFFKSTSDIARAKAEIFEGLEAGGLALLNADNEHCDLLMFLAKEAGVSRVALFGEKAGTECRLEKVTLNANSSEISATIFGEKVSFTLSVPGRHWVQNTLGILGAVKEVGASLEKACNALSSLSAPSGRGAFMTLESRGKTITVIDESYNASPDAMQAAFKVLGQMLPGKGGRRIAVLGDMLELGEASAEIHANLANDITGNGIDMVYASGPNMRCLLAALPALLKAGHGTRSQELVKPLLGALKDGDIILIKGSLGSKMKVVLDALIAAFDTVPGESKAGV